MTDPSDNGLDAPPALLNAFARAVATAGDSPTVISRVAENAAYVGLCRHIVALDATEEVPPLLEAACRRAGISLPRLRSRLTPVARALHLVPEALEATYYQVLGVPPDSDAEDIRRAYRRRARDLHPDLQPDQASDHEAFAELTAAYETLRDPDAKEAYDARPRPAADWYEPAPRTPSPRPRRARFTAVIAAVLLLVAAALVLDQLDRRRARRSAFQAARHLVIRPVAAPPRPSLQEPQTSAPAEKLPPPIAENDFGTAGENPTRPLMVRTAPSPSALPDLMPAADLVRSPPSALPPDPAQPAASEAAPGKTGSGSATTPAAALPRLAIFHAGADSARLSRELADRLSDSGFPPAHIGHSPEALKRVSDVRYFNAADRDAARALRNAVQIFLADSAPRLQPSVRLKNLSRRYPHPENGLLEVWLNTGAVATAATAALETAPALPPSAPVETPEKIAAGDEVRPTDTQIRAFIDDYCRTYETRDPDRLAALFDPAATENGQPFRDLLPRYRANMERLEALSYHIEMDRWKARSDRSTLCVEGRFTARGRMTERKEYQSRGTIAMDIVPHGTSYRILRLEYRMDKNK